MSLPEVRGGCLLQIQTVGWKIAVPAVLERGRLGCGECEELIAQALHGANQEAGETPVLQHCRDGCAPPWRETVIEIPKIYLDARADIGVFSARNPILPCDTHFYIPPPPASPMRGRMRCWSDSGAPEIPAEQSILFPFGPAAVALSAHPSWRRIASAKPGKKSAWCLQTAATELRTPLFNSPNSPMLALV